MAVLIRYELRVNTATEKSMPNGLWMKMQ